jgi:hypothetical protein
VDGDRELDHTEVGSEVSTRTGNLLDEEGADLLSEIGQLLVVEAAEIIWAGDRGPAAPSSSVLLIAMPGACSPFAHPPRNL